VPVIVHVGLHKTGSTWLQQEVLPNLVDVAYLPGRPARRWLAGIVSGAPVAPTFDPPRAPTVVWSSEELAGFLWDPIDPEVAAQRLASALPGASILLFTREPEAWRSSVYAQYVNEGGYRSTASFWAAVPVACTGTEPERVIEAFQRSFAVVHVLRYEDVRADAGAVAERVAALCGTTLRAPVSAQVHNRSLSRPVRQVLRVWNRLFRRSRFNPSPLLPMRGAVRMRGFLQRRIDPRVPERWR